MAWLLPGGPGTEKSSRHWMVISLPLRRRSAVDRRHRSAMLVWPGALRSGEGHQGSVSPLELAEVCPVSVLRAESGLGRGVRVSRPGTEADRSTELGCAEQVHASESMGKAYRPRTAGAGRPQGNYVDSYEPSQKSWWKGCVVLVLVLSMRPTAFVQRRQVEPKQPEKEGKR